MVEKVTHRGDEISSPENNFPLRHFRKIFGGRETESLVRELSDNSDAWPANTSRQDKIAVQRDTNTIFIRTAKKRPDLPLNENQKNDFSQIASRFPLATSLMQKAAADLGGSLERASIVRLKPHSHVYPHVDWGSYYLIRDRYHFVVQSQMGSFLSSGKETAIMKEGELWWFNNKEFHKATNDSDYWRIHYIFDVLPTRYQHLAVNPERTDL